MDKTIFWIPDDAYVDGAGYRVSFVVAGEPGHHPTGNWPYSGAPEETRPYFWGHDLKAARETAYRQNERLGVSREETDRIVAESIVASMRKR